jgi:hypothetical protein
MSEKTRKTVFRAYGAWNSEGEERWLSRMAGNGWHLTAPRAILYRFVKGEPADVVYRMDYRSPAKGERDEYLGLFRDAGWEHVGEFGNWHYFRIPAGEGPAPEIHTDPESKIAMFRRLLGLLAVVSVAVWVPVLTGLADRSRPHTYWYSIRGFQIAILAFFVYAVVRIALKIKRLKDGRAGEESK